MSPPQTTARPASSDSRNPSSRPLRILHVQDKCGHGGSQIQGVQQLLVWWWPAFREAGIDAAICILRGRNPASERFDEVGIPITYLDRGRFDPRTLPDLVRLVREREIDVLHCHGYGSTTFGRLAGAITRTPVLVHEHMIDDAMPGYQGMVDRLLAPLATRGVAVSGAVADFMSERRHLDADRITVVGNGVPDEFFCRVSPEERAAVLTDVGLDPHKLYVGIVGRLHPVKGHDVFLDAVARIARDHPEARFLAVGDGALLEPLRARARELGVDDVARFLGFQEDLLSYLKAFDVLVVASRSEGSPLTVFQGMAAGKAMVATRVGGIPEILTDGENALLVDSEAPAAMGEAMGRLLGDPELRERLGRAAEALCDREHRVRHTVARFDALYHDVLATSRSPER